MFTQGCNFQCPFCHNPELIDIGKKGVFCKGEIFDFLKKKKGFIDGVCITGGEPTLQKDLVFFIEKIKKLGFLVKLDTNGSYPRILKELVDRKLIDYIAMDVKSSWRGYLEITKLRNCEISKLAISNCRESMRLIQESGIAHEFRTTVFPQKHKEKDFVEIAKCLEKGEKYCIQNIEYEKNLDKDIEKIEFDVGGLVDKLKKEFPDLRVEGRG